MYTLPVASDDILTKYQGTTLEGYSAFENFTIIWCGEPSKGTLTRATVLPKHIFVLRNRREYKWVYQDSGGFLEVPEKWYGKCFLKLNFKPSENKATVKVKNAFVELPYYPASHFAKMFTSKKRKRFAQIKSDVTFPTWEHVNKQEDELDIAKSFKTLFDRADANEIELKNPFEGYSSIESILKNKVGKLAYMTVACFIYHHCRVNLGYPTNLS